MQNNPDLELLREDLRQGESVSVEFKGDFPPQARDLANDIASFATTNGGRSTCTLTHVGT